MEDRGYLDEATAIKATQNSERQPYDVVRQALKSVELDSSRRVELEDYVDVFPDFVRYMSIDLKANVGKAHLQDSSIKLRSWKYGV